GHYLMKVAFMLVCLCFTRFFYIALWLESLCTIQLGCGESNSQQVLNQKRHLEEKMKKTTKLKSKGSCKKCTRYVLE
ncbi:unnamed protein product, partial [Linum tenue]